MCKDDVEAGLGFKNPAVVVACSNECRIQIKKPWVLDRILAGILFPGGPCAPVVYTLAPKYLCRDYFKAKVYTICGPLGIVLGS